MKKIQSLHEMRGYTGAFRKKGKMVGLVPTMGKLHEGHLSLMRRAKRDCNVVVVTIFVNPTQFSPGEDYNNYPRDLENDMALARETGADVMFCPTVEGLYPPGFRSKIILPGLDDKLCGRSRPIHFSGVATIVAKLLNLILPDRAYFGEKDFQQLLIIKRLVKDLNMAVEIIGCPIVRDPDGVAMSSRNAYLSEEERKSARSLYQSLTLVKSLVSSGENRAQILKDKIRRIIGGNPHTKIDYISICHPSSLEEIEIIQDTALAALAVWVGRARLIDNQVLSF